MKHEHAVELKLSPALQDSVDGIHDNLVEHRNAYVIGGIGGVVVGLIASRFFRRPVINVNLVVPTNP